MFDEKQLEALSGPLNRSAVKTRSQAGRALSYIEGWHAIEEANRIFGFGDWDRETVELRQLGEPREVDGKMRVGYMARVRITVRARETTVIRDGCGYGSGIDKDAGSAHESALKEAETDAMKRALMTFGNPFGLALYDKEQVNVVSDVKPVAVVSSGIKEPAVSMAAIGLEREVKSCRTVPDLEGLKRQPEFKAAWHDLSDTDRSYLIPILTRHRMAIEPNEDSNIRKMAGF